MIPKLRNAFPSGVTSHQRSASFSRRKKPVDLKFLAFHPKVETDSYPGLASHPQHEIAKKQMSDFGGMVTFTIKGGFEEGKKLMDAVKLATVAVSLGDCDTLISHPASTTHSTYSPEERDEAGVLDNLIRISVGIEDIADILDDLNQALRML